MLHGKIILWRGSSRSKSTQYASAILPHQWEVPQRNGQNLNQLLHICAWLFFNSKVKICRIGHQTRWRGIWLSRKRVIIQKHGKSSISKSELVSNARCSVASFFQSTLWKLIKLTIENHRFHRRIIKLDRPLQWIKGNERWYQMVHLYSSLFI